MEVEQIKNQGATYEVKFLDKFLTQDVVSTLAGMWSDPRPHLAEPYVFISGAPKVEIVFKGSNFDRRPANLLVLDKNRHPLVLAGVDVLVPRR
jgi:hypothetical protein